MFLMQIRKKDYKKAKSTLSATAYHLIDSFGNEEISKQTKKKSSLYPSKKSVERDVFCDFRNKKSLARFHFYSWMFVGNLLHWFCSFDVF